MDVPTSTILLVEDDPFLAREVTAALQRHISGLHVVHCPSGSGAWQSLHNHPRITLVILDQYLAAGDLGTELAAQLQADPRYHNIPRIAYSQVQVDPASFTTCLIKSADHQNLADIVRSLLNA